MRILRYFNALLVSSACITCVQAEMPVPDDFAYGLEVRTEGRASLWQIWLPEEVYFGVTRADLGDIRVFDASDRIMPHMLRSLEATTGEARAPVSLPFFPLYTGDDGQSDSSALRIITDDEGAVVKIVREWLTAETPEVISAYLIDATKIQHKPDRLILDWQSASETGFAASIDVDTSNDLSIWHRLKSNASLADLQFGEHQLSQHEVDLPPASYKYLRVSWPEALRKVELTQATVAFPSTDTPPQRNWMTMTGSRNPGSPASYEYDTNGNWPIDQARIDLPEKNMSINIELSSRADENAPWHRKYRGLFYKLLKEDGAMLVSPAAVFSVTSDRFWRVEETGGGNVLEGYAPVLELGWIPHVLTFVAQGNPPYVLAYGNATIEPLEQPIDPMLLSGEDSGQQVVVREATIQSGYVLGGEEKLKPPPQPFAWRKLLLWAVLVTGTALLFWMVWRLSRELHPPARQ